MGTIVIEKKFQDVVSTLADQLHKSQNEVVQDAIEEYAKKIMRKKTLMSYAGMLKDEDADDLIHLIRDSRADKNIEPSL
ncbi:hypothetical protein JW960_17320 [candidate division KSB1 bacterium]|nr:hypothetical protein [candidate division KSB1 bacterium]